jgi:hypothetical protein
MKTLWLFFGLAALALSSHASGQPALVGVWKLLSYQSEFQDGSPKRPMFGEHPTGYIVFTAEGRMMAVIEAEGRTAPSSDSDRAALLKSLIAYSGKYRVESKQWITTVDVSWNPAWDGTDQVRTFQIVGDRLNVTSPWLHASNFPGSGLSRGSLVFERVK